MHATRHRLELFLVERRCQGRRRPGCPRLSIARSIRRSLKTHSLRVFLYAFAEATATRATKTHLAWHWRAAIRAGADTLRVYVAGCLFISVSFSLHGGHSITDETVGRGHLELFPCPYTPGEARGLHLVSSPGELL